MFDLLVVFVETTLENLNTELRNFGYIRNIILYCHWEVPVSAQFNKEQVFMIL
jgi:hypothetical protein